MAWEIVRRTSTSVICRISGRNLRPSGPNLSLRPNTALSLQHGAKICDAFSVIPFASGLLQEPVADAAMHFRQWQAPTVGPRGKKAGACARAGGLAAYVATPA